VAYRGKSRDGKETVLVWNAETGEPAAVEKAVAGVPGSLAFTPDSKRLIVAAPGAYTEFDLATAKTAAEWKRDKPADRAFLEDRYGARIAAVPGGKGVVSVAATGKRRQSYTVRLATEKKDWFLGEFWDYASQPTVSPDGRWLAISGGGFKEHGTFLLRLDADGNPELEDKPEKARPPFGGGDGKKVPAWREWAAGEANPAGRGLPGTIAFSPDGKRVFVGGAGGQLRVCDPEKRELKATLAAAAGAKDKLPEWLIQTPAGEFVGSPAEEKAFAKPGTDPNPAKVKEALGVK
jgi:WD40 repeat protein